ncbi:MULTISPECIES: ClpXP protease specificity-enhancing factor [unclassified Comamonas]|uniref:ClpXP protease specificity-enhancing factor n=1 Tax=unclassified Comamonas TaxID=2638500 RepID=UPI0030A8217B
MSEIQTTSTQPYLIRAWVEWCNDNGLTPYLSVRVDKTVLVPREFVKDGEIVLNISYDATSALKLGNDYIEFTARFGGVPRDIMVPVSRVVAIFARETGQGMGFPPPEDLLDDDADIAMAALEGAGDAGEPAGEANAASPVMQVVTSSDEPPAPDGKSPGRAGKGGKPSLKLVK